MHVRLLQQAGVFVQPGFLRAEVVRRLNLDMSKGRGVRGQVLGAQGFQIDRSVRAAEMRPVKWRNRAAVTSALLRLRPALDQCFGISLGTPERIQFLNYRRGDFNPGLQHEVTTVESGLRPTAVTWFPGTPPDGC
jgi:predicted 2-oxoglutarate/Fe(II)-dependent dioxygenase YbiX